MTGRALASYTIWTQVRRHRGGYAVAVSAIALRGHERAGAADYSTDYCNDLGSATATGHRLAWLLAREIERRGDDVISSDITIERDESLV